MITMLKAHPERLVIVVATLSWGWMLGEAAFSQRLSCCGSHPTLATDFALWMAMAAAMMLPTTTSAVRDVAIRSYRSRRLLAVTEYLGGYFTCWILAGIVFTVLRICPITRDPRSAAVLCLLSGAWALIPVRGRWFAHCHRQIPLCPVGPRADLDAVRQGMVHGNPCVKMCWPLMFACGITGHDLVVMMGGSLLAIAEKRMFRLSRPPLVVGSFVLAAWILVRSAIARTEHLGLCLPFDS
jgi:predicted metal-binding membrane protein